MLAYTTALPANTKTSLLCILMCCVQVSADMAKLVEKGVNSFKFFFAYKHEGLMVRDEVGRLCSKAPCALPGWLHICPALCQVVLRCSSHTNTLGHGGALLPYAGSSACTPAPVMCSSTF